MLFGAFAISMNEEKEQTKSFVMYETFFQYADLLLDDAEMGRFVRLMRDYAINGKDAHSSDPKIEGLLIITKPLVSASTGRYKAAVNGGKHGNKGAGYGHLGGRPRNGETREEANERRRKERELKEQEQAQELQPVVEPISAVETRENPNNPLNENVNENFNDYEKNNVKENLNEKVKDNVEEYEEKKSIDYFLKYFVNYHYDFNYNLLLYEKDLFYEKYKYSVDTLRDNIEKGTGIPISVEATLCYLLEYLQLTGGLH